MALRRLESRLLLKDHRSSNSFSSELALNELVATIPEAWNDLYQRRPAKMVSSHDHMDDFRNILPPLTLHSDIQKKVKKLHFQLTWDG